VLAPASESTQRPADAHPTSAGNALDDRGVERKDKRTFRARCRDPIRLPGIAEEV